MKYVDRILEYLSGDMQEEEAEKFREELEIDSELNSEYRAIKTIYDKLEEMMPVSSEKNVNKGKLLQDIIADQDIPLYSGPPGDKDEEAFMSKLNESILRAKARKKKKPGPLSSIISPLLYLAVAASLVFFIVWMLPDGSNESLFKRFYKPMSDKSLAYFGERSRGNTETGIALFYSGRYKEAMKQLRPHLQSSEADSLSKLFYALACMEIGCDEDLTPWLKPGNLSTGSNIQAARIWYYGLYLLQKDNSGTARIYLNSLTLNPNPYHQNARRLIRKMD